MTHPHFGQPAVTLSVRVPCEVRDQLEELADATGRTKSFLAAKAIESYLIAQAWQIKAIEKAVKKADSKNATFIDHEQVANWLGSWGTQEEQDPPK